MSFTNKIFSGILWSSIQTIIQRSFAFVIKLFLARLLFPEDFGIIGMAVVFTSFIQVFNDLGFGSALIQKNEDELTEDYFYTAFWTGILWSVLIYLIIVFIVAPFASWFYEEEILNTIIPVLSIGVLAGPVNMVHRVQLTRKLNFKRLAIINNSSSIFSGVLALILAYLGFGVWALVFNSIAQFVIAMPQYFIATGWTPKFIWNKNHFKDLFGFGVFTSFSSLVARFGSQGDYLLIGKFIGKSELGLYSFAFIITDSIRSQVKQVINSVFFPVYSQYQNEREKQFTIYNLSIFYNALVIMPLMSILLFAPEFIVYLFGDKWASSIIIIQIISVSAMLEIITASFPILLRANNLPGLEFKLELVKVGLFYLPLILIGVIYYGIVGAAIGVLFSRFLAAIMNLIIIKNKLKLSSIDVFKNFLKGASASFISLFVCYIILYIFDFNNDYIVIVKFFLIISSLIIFTLVLNKKDLLILIKGFRNKN